jgi:hypothetical protein
MVRTVFVTLIATLGLAVPAMAGTISGNSATSDSPAKFTRLDTALDNAAGAQQVRDQLEHNGFTHVSALMRDSSGRFAGTAIKNGKTVMVAVVFPPSQQHPQPAID